MDPLSITTSCLALAGCIAKVSRIIIELTRDARNANKDMDAISTELQALADILTPFATSLPTLTAVPETLLGRVDTIIVGCATVVDQIDKQLVRYKRSKVFAKIGWVVFGQSDMQKLRDNLTGYKTALNLGIQIISISVNQVVKDDTTAIREQNEALMANVDTILAQLKDTQSAKSSAPRKRIEEWMNDIDALTSYAETTYAETTYAGTTYAETVVDEPTAADDDATTVAPNQPLPDQSENGNVFQPVYHEGDPGQGIGGYNLRSPNDRCFALDYNSTGKLDHLVLFRAGTGIISVLHKDPSGVFTPVFSSSFGLGAYDILDPCDRALAFDYTSTGHLDHILLYRRGHGILYVLARTPTNNTYTTVFKSHSGIAGLDLASPLDRIFAFDYARSGKQDHLAIYRPGTGTFWILRNDTHTTSTIGSSATFTPVYKSTTSPAGVGIGGYPLLRDHDRAFAFDWEGTGKMDHIVLYRGGDRLFSVVGRDNNETGGFSTVWTTAAGARDSVGGYDLADPRDVAFAYDWGHTGRRDHVVLYRPGTGTLGVMARDRNTDHGWKCVFWEGGGRGVGGYDLLSDDDKVFAFDYDTAGRADCLVAYRANGTGTIWILKHV